MRGAAGLGETGLAMTLGIARLLLLATPGMTGGATDAIAVKR